MCSHFSTGWFLRRFKTFSRSLMWLRINSSSSIDPPHSKSKIWTYFSYRSRWRFSWFVFLSWHLYWCFKSLKSAISIILSYHLVALFEYWFMFWLRRHLPAKQALNSKQSAKGYERIIWDIWLLYMSSSLTVRPQRKYRAWHYWLLTQQKLSKVPYFLYF